MGGRNPSLVQVLSPPQESVLRPSDTGRAASLVQLLATTDRGVLENPHLLLRQLLPCFMSIAKPLVPVVLGGIGQIDALGHNRSLPGPSALPARRVINILD